MSLLDAILGHALVIETIWSWLFYVDNFQCEDEPCYGISGRCHPEVYFLTY